MAGEFASLLTTALSVLNSDKAFHQAMDTARGLKFFLLYPPTLEMKDVAQYKAFTSPKEYFLRCVSLPSGELE